MRSVGKIDDDIRLRRSTRRPCGEIVRGTDVCNVMGESILGRFRSGERPDMAKKVSGKAIDVEERKTEM